MFLAISNSAMTYDWGSTTAIAELQGREPDGSPEAELWFGTHPVSPSKILGGRGDAADSVSLTDWIQENRALALGGGSSLPFLLKFLSADSCLSLQAHPSTVQAEEGYRRENEAGIALESPVRNYRDPFAKPELLLAISDEFEVLCGFSPLSEATRALQEVGLSEFAGRISDLRQAIAWLLEGGSEVSKMIEKATEIAQSGDSIAADTVRRLSDRYPGDPGILCALLLNRATLKRGEAIFLPAGNIHAYMRGVGIELMAPSDNVLRGGLTSKHVDSAELLKILDFERGELPRLAAEQTNGHLRFEPKGSGLSLNWFAGDGVLMAEGPKIALCTDGAFAISGGAETVKMKRGDAVFITSDESELRVVGAGDLFVAGIESGR
ncbi:MAG: mannose-6-phosphate isomerase, class I [Cryobacterium sp.]|nr:mannose-6-phosphate isomerase, class I [Cryobacterium sp.]